MKLVYLRYLLVPASFALNVFSYRAYIPEPKKQAILTNGERALSNVKNKGRLGRQDVDG